MEFRLPGHHDVFIGGRHSDSDSGLDVTLENLDEYVNAMVQGLLVDTVAPQVRCLQRQAGCWCAVAR